MDFLYSNHKRKDFKHDSFQIDPIVAFFFESSPCDPEGDDRIRFLSCTGVGWDRMMCGVDHQKIYSFGVFCPMSVPFKLLGEFASR